MAAKDRRVDELDDELARLEAELAALERGEDVPSPAKPKKKLALAERFQRKREAPEAPAPEPAAPAEAPEPAHEETPASGVAKRFGRFLKKEAAPAPETPAEAPATDRASKLLGRFRKKAKAEEPEAAPAESPGAPAEAAPAVSLTPAAPPLAPDAAQWIQEGRLWRRIDASKPRQVLRRRLTESGEIALEGPATQGELNAATGAEEGEKAVTRGLFSRFRVRKDTE